jgi:hypothetical protein
MDVLTEDFDIDAIVNVRSLDSNPRRSYTTGYVTQ